MKKLFYILIFFLFLSTVEAQIAVIANKSVPTNQLTKSQLFDIYSGEIRSWNNGDIIYVFDLPIENEVRESFYELLDKSSARMKSIWMKKLLSGEGEPPQKVDTEELMINKITRIKGAIGFIASKKITNDIKVIKIIE